MESREVWWRRSDWNPWHRWVVYSLLLQDRLLFPFTKGEEIWKCCMHVSSPTNFFVQALKVGYDENHMLCITALTWTYLTPNSFLLDQLSGQFWYISNQRMTFLSWFDQPNLYFSDCSVLISCFKIMYIRDSCYVCFIYIYIYI